MPLTKVDYQFSGTEHSFTLKAHGSSRNASKPYIRTQKSTITTLKEAVSTSQPRVAFDRVAEELGGMSCGSSSGSWPKDVKQAYNLKSRTGCKPLNVAVTSDPYLALVMQCKEDAKDQKTAYIRQVTCAPEPVVILTTDEQIDNLVKFCTNSVHFGVFAVDPTFDLGSFSVTTTTYENLHLISRRGGVHPVMIGPMLIHQKKEATTYSVLVDYLPKSRPELRNLRVLGTDGELALSSPFLQKCSELIHLLCFIHFKNNIVNNLKSIGVDECNRKCIVADLFGQQQGTRFEEGIVDSDDEEEFRTRLTSLKTVWLQRLGLKGFKFHQWFVMHKADLMEKKMLKPVRRRAGLGQPPKPYYTNRVECANSLLSSETGHKELPVNEFVAAIRALTERQARNVRWAIINKGPYRLHPGLSHLELLEETWFQMGNEEKESYVKMVLQSDVHLTATPALEIAPGPSTLNGNSASGLPTYDSATHGLSVLADAAFTVLDLQEESCRSKVIPHFPETEQSDVGSAFYLEELDFEPSSTSSEPCRSLEKMSTSFEPRRSLEKMSTSSEPRRSLEKMPTSSETRRSLEKMSNSVGNQSIQYKTKTRQDTARPDFYPSRHHYENRPEVPEIDTADVFSAQETYPETRISTFCGTVSQQSVSFKDKERRSASVDFGSPRNDQCTHMVTLEEFSQFFTEQPLETIKGIYEKANNLLHKPNAIVPAPGCDPKARMVESSRFKERPHLVVPGKKKGEYRCEKNCPHFNGIRICSHSVATAQQNGELSSFLLWFQESFSKKGVNLTSTVKTDMPKNPGRKGGKPSTSRKPEKLPMAERVKRTYSVEGSPAHAQTANTNPFYVKRMNTRIKVCQGCRGSLKSVGGGVQHPPFDYCVARHERRPFTDRKSGELRTPSGETAAHYHLRVACIKAAEQSFVLMSLKLPSDLQLTPIHEEYLRAEFGLEV